MHKVDTYTIEFDDVTIEEAFVSRLDENKYKVMLTMRDNKDHVTIIQDMTIDKEELDYLTKKLGPHVKTIRAMT